jgi:hypothetical protein
MEARKLECDPACRAAVEEVRDDGNKLDWVAFKYASRSKLEVDAKGDGGYASCSSAQMYSGASCRDAGGLVAHMQPIFKH